jgi:hypothetical protein
MRNSPHLADRLAAYPDGTQLQTIDAEVDGDGTHWQHVRAPDGKEGFVPGAYALATRPAEIAMLTATPTRPIPTATPAPTSSRVSASPTVQPVTNLGVVTGGGSGCGSRGGPGYRLNNGKCASWEDARRGRR